MVESGLVIFQLIEQWCESLGKITWGFP